MNKNKFLGIYVVLILTFSVFVIHHANAELGPINDYSDIRKQADTVRDKAGFDPQSNIGSIMATVIKSFIAILGIIFIYLIVIAGYNWMTAGGDEEKVKKAKDTIWRAVIGLIIIVTAYAITQFVFTRLGDVSGAGGGNTQNQGGSGWD